MKLLEAQELSFSFGPTTIFDSLDFHIGEGEFVTILGPSGSGKSTLFQLVGGLLTPSGGSIILNGQNITNQTGHISYMPQTPSLLPWRTILENVLLGMELKGAKDRSKAEQMLEKAGLLDYRDAYPSELSGGMKQRVAFIRAILAPQPIICLDEPFSALDELTRQDMGAWLLSIWEENRKTILFITHNTEEALFLSDRILLMSSKPAFIKKEILVPFSRPRALSLAFSDSFLQVKKELVRTLRN